MNKKFSIAILVLSSMILLSVASGHKESAEMSRIDYSYRISLGFKPVHPSLVSEQEMYLKVQDFKDMLPVSGLKVAFVISKDNRYARLGSDRLTAHLMKDMIAAYDAAETEKGIYSVKHAFKEKGNYIVEAKIYKDNIVVSEMSRNISVEPNAPSPMFWVYMLSAVAIGAFLASKSHKFD